MPTCTCMYHATRIKNILTLLTDARPPHTHCPLAPPTFICSIFICISIETYHTT